jgi:hypothetical protein
MTGNGGTFPGRMAAWCPEGQVGYNVSLAEMGEMSREARYYVAGFLAGNQPGPPPPPGPDDDIDPGDLAAWQVATSRSAQWLLAWPVADLPGLRLCPAP